MFQGVANVGDRLCFGSNIYVYLHCSNTDTLVDFSGPGVMNSGSYLGSPFDSSTVGYFDAGTKSFTVDQTVQCTFTNSADNTFMKTFNIKWNGTSFDINETSNPS